MDIFSVKKQINPLTIRYPVGYKIYNSFICPVYVYPISFIINITFEMFLNLCFTDNY